MVVGVLEDKAGEGRSVGIGQEFGLVVEATLKVKYLVCLVFLQNQFLGQLG